MISRLHSNSHRVSLYFAHVLPVLIYQLTLILKPPDENCHTIIIETVQIEDEVEEKKGGRKNEIRSYQIRSRSYLILSNSIGLTAPHPSINVYLTLWLGPPLLPSTNSLRCHRTPYSDPRFGARSYRPSQSSI